MAIGPPYADFPFAGALSRVYPSGKQRCFHANGSVLAPILVGNCRMPKKSAARKTVKTVAKKTATKKTASAQAKTTGSPTKKRATSAKVPTTAGLGRVDRKILELLNQRAELAQAIGQSRLQTSTIPFSTGEVNQMLDDLVERNDGPLSDAAVRSVFRELQSGCRALVKPIRVAHLGPEYSYSHLAAMSRFGQSVDFVPVGTIQAVFDEVDCGHADYGLVPLENSTDGRIADTLDMFTRLPLRICGEVALPIHHTLLGTESRSAIREVYSKPQALSQCRKWLARHLPSARPVEMASTSTAAELAKRTAGAAAIASVQAGVHYGLDVLAENIEDNQGNVTRFSVIGSKAAQRTGNDKTAVMFELDDRSGALAEALAIFKRNRVNLTWIESFPIPEAKRAYLFFLEMEGHEDDLRVRRAMASLEKRTVLFRVLGSFPAVEAEN